MTYLRQGGDCGTRPARHSLNNVFISGFISTGTGSREDRSLTGVEMKSLYYPKTSRVYILAVDKMS